MTLARPGPQSHPRRAAEKPASQRPTHDCPPGSTAPAADGLPATLGDPRVSTGEAPALPRPGCAAQALKCLSENPRRRKKSKAGD